MPIDSQEIMLTQLASIGNQGVMNNQVLAQYLPLVFTKDMVQGGQGETGVILGAMNSADRTPVIKT